MFYILAFLLNLSNQVCTLHISVRKATLLVLKSHSGRGHRAVQQRCKFPNCKAAFPEKGW